MQMLFIPFESPPPQHHDSSVKHFYFPLHVVSLVFSTAVHPNKTWSLHYTLSVMQTVLEWGRRISICALCKINWAKGHACNISDKIPNPGIFIVELPFAVFNRGLKNTEHKYIVSLPSYLPVLDIANVSLVYWNGELFYLQLPVTVHQFVFSPPSVSSVWCRSSWRSHKSAQDCIPRC